MIKITDKIQPAISTIVITEDESGLEGLLSSQEIEFVKSQINHNNNQIGINKYDYWLFIQIINKKEDLYQTLEFLRKEASKLNTTLNRFSISDISITGNNCRQDYILAYAEGLALANYRFLKYYNNKKDKASTLQTIRLPKEYAAQQDVDQLNNTIQGVFYARNLINEPLSYLTAPRLAEEIKTMGNEAGFKVTVLDKKQIEELKMGGLQAVNRGSIDPPTFSILEWKPAHVKNKKPIVLVGKGIVYDTGGLSLKPTRNSMDEMKSDMSGGAAVAGILYSVAKSKLPVHVIGLVPATDNRPDGNAYTPGDVIEMFDGTTVEVLNTDAEGRMIMADALSYAKKYDPEMVIDLATLTGSAAIAIGKYGIVAMGNADNQVFEQLKQSGEHVYERIVQFPFWDEYADLLKSGIADMKNIGGREAGAITAGKFLEHFTSYPYIHLDIAGTAFTKQKDSYRGTGGTGSGVRLLTDFLKAHISN
jgi:leucyl aminopeptidase